MYAVMKTGGKQYRVQPGDMLRVEKLPAEAGDTVEFDQVLMLGGDGPQVGTPLVAGAAVQAEIVEQVKADKVITFVRRRRKHSSKRRRGHRQALTLIRITGITADGATLAETAQTTPAEQAAPAATAPEAQKTED
ncbi:MAG: 50S ribosomal protein L21 [Rhodobacteraceae bacterium]|jgi:large subunit ribosomal protein L21|nr:50S ribosomal protein L21 [Paracoccaceae bacterium]MBL4557321.1 50S ribosomal protein L21 [Paracoccaceae bacterium]HBG98040.1 50S ribosomal protein L21 [Paracoccaceae bacterium]